MAVLCRLRCHRSRHGQRAAARSWWRPADPTHRMNVERCRSKPSVSGSRTRRQRRRASRRRCTACRRWAAARAIHAMPVCVGMGRFHVCEMQSATLPCAGAVQSLQHRRPGLVVSTGPHCSAPLCQRLSQLACRNAESRAHRVIALRLRWPGRRRHDGACAAAQFDEFMSRQTVLHAQKSWAREGVVGQLKAYGSRGVWPQVAPAPAHEPGFVSPTCFLFIRILQVKLRSLRGVQDLQGPSLTEAGFAPRPRTRKTPAL